MYPVSAAYRHAMRRQVRDQGYVRLQFGIFDASAPGLSDIHYQINILKKFLYHYHFFLLRYHLY